MVWTRSWLTTPAVARTGAGASGSSGPIGPAARGSRARRLPAAEPAAVHLFADRRPQQDGRLRKRMAAHLLDRGVNHPESGQRRPRLVVVLLGAAALEREEASARLEQRQRPLGELDD